MTERTTAETPLSVKVWDLPTRLFHWGLVGAVVLQWWTAEQLDYDLHFTAGQAILALLLARIAYGFIGPDTARFSTFLKGPGATLAYARTIAAPDGPKHAGHNPLGGWMTLALILTLLALSITGLLSNEDVYYTQAPLAHLVPGDISDEMTGLHKDLFDVLLALIGVHITANVLQNVTKEHDLIAAMITGCKTWPEGSAPALRFVPPYVAGGLFAAALGAVFGLIALA